MFDVKEKVMPAGDDYGKGWNNDWDKLSKYMNSIIDNKYSLSLYTFRPVP
jgi:hypothetical protein